MSKLIPRLRIQAHLTLANVPAWAAWFEEFVGGIGLTNVTVEYGKK